MTRARLLGPADHEAVARILEPDPVRHCFLESRLRAGLLEPNGPGQLWGYPAQRPYALLHQGTNLVPVGVDAEAQAAFVEAVGPWRTCVAIVGVATEVLPLWRALASRWGNRYARARVVRPRQLLMAQAVPSELPAHPGLRFALPEDFKSYLGAAVAMYTEELLEDPLASNAGGYRSYVRSLIGDRRAFTITADGAVVFKADLGAISPRVAQVQGVWVRPDRRGRGLGAHGMAGVTNAIIAGGRTASLYVNDFNAPAIAVYRRCGYREVGIFASVLF
ncbi:MAG: GNAT family N-acetyltransferase [Propioniciclava sp.]